jgi:hypothetical protein
VRKQVVFLSIVASLAVAACEKQQPAAPKTAVPTAPQPDATAVPPAPAAAPSDTSLPSLPKPDLGAVASLGGDGKTLTLPGGWKFEVPEGWQVKPPSNAMRLGELHVGEPAIVAAFSMAGGDAESNVTRWAQQFKDESGSAPKPEVEKRDIGGRSVQLIHLRGEYLGMGQQAPEPGTILHGALIENAAAGQHLFIKMTGPAARMESLRAPFVKMVESVTKE